MRECAGYKSARSFFVCENELTGALDFYEVKTDPARFDPSALEAKVASFFAKNPDLRTGHHDRKCLSIGDM